jgi:hypothetical protein
LTVLLLAALFILCATSTANSTVNNDLAYSLGDGRNVTSGFWKLAFAEDSAGKIRPWRSHISTSSDSKIGVALPICSESKTTACIKSVSVRQKNQSWQSGVALPAFGQRFYHYSSFAEDSMVDKETSTWNEERKRNLPSAATPRAWELPVAHKGGSSYLVSVGFEGYGTGANNQDSFNFNRFEASISPTSLTPNSNSTNCRDGQLEELSEGGAGMCLRAYDFPQETEFKIEVLLGTFNSNLSGWLDARIINGSFTFNKKTRLLTIQGAPAQVPVVSTEEIKFAEVESDSSLCAVAFCKNDSWPQMKMNSSFGIFSSQTSNDFESLKSFKKIEKFLPEKAAGLNTIWRFSSMPTAGDFSKCAPQGDFSGIISTNATVYTPGPPSWSRKTGEVSFEVGAPHLINEDQEFLGYYKLFVSELVANCVWGVNLANAQAKVEIVDSGDKTKAETTSVKLENGWVTFKAEGFTFSTPEIKVSLIATKASTSVPTTTISCLKGKTVKKVTGKGARCPAGFKKI